MIAAEKSFAAYAVANNTVDAFLKFMDTSAVMFKNGEPYKAYGEWLKKEKRPGVLNWWPLYAEIANSGDFGWTAGQWTFQPNTVNDSIVANGNFFTIWQRNKKGEWKFILDVGTDSGLLLKDTSIIKLAGKKIQNRDHSLKEAIERLVLASKNNQIGVAESFNTKDMIRVSAGQALGQQVTSLPLNVGSPNMSVPKMPRYEVLGFGVSSTNDIGYSYGRFVRPENDKKQMYLHIWRHEPDGWKIALQLLR